MFFVSNYFFIFCSILFAKCQIKYSNFNFIFEEPEPNKYLCLL